MKDEGEIERLLAQVPVPSLRESPHRQQLKAELLHPTKRWQREGEEPMKVTRRSRMTRLMKLAAGMLIAALLVATGWAAEKVYRGVAQKYVELERIEHPPKTLSGAILLSADVLAGLSIPADAPPGTAEKAGKHHEEIKQLIAGKKHKLVKTTEMQFGQKEYTYRFTLADGSSLALNFLIPLEDVDSWKDYLQKTEKIPVFAQGGVAVVGTSIPADSPPGTAEKAKRHHEEMKQLIARKKYELVRTLEKGGRKRYEYRFTFADGEHDTQTFSLPLKNVASWEDYWQKKEDREKQRQDKINRAISSGKFRLLDVEAISIHICRDADSDRKLRVQRLVGPDGKDEALVYPEVADVTKHENPWEKWPDHLQAVRQGKRVLLDLEILKSYTYEITLDDGSTTIFNYGGGRPLEKLTAEERATFPGAITGGATSGGF